MAKYLYVCDYKNKCRKGVHLWHPALTYLCFQVVPGKKDCRVLMLSNNAEPCACIVLFQCASCWLGKALKAECRPLLTGLWWVIIATPLEFSELHSGTQRKHNSEMCRGCCKRWVSTNCQIKRSERMIRTTFSRISSKLPTSMFWPLPPLQGVQYLWHLN